MDTDAEQFFQSHFLLLTDRKPYPWQEKLFVQVIERGWPNLVDLPTGAGKSAIVYIWLLALSWDRKSGSTLTPRRLVWVVNRRVVVDQITAEVEQLLGRLESTPTIHELLRSASPGSAPLIVSTLRGQRVDPGAWSRDPSAAAIVIGTVDMIGSRLLFRGYQAGPYHRPIHAGLLAVDSLIVNDEAHLSPAFGHLLQTVHAMGPAACLSGKHFQVLLLSATHSATSLGRFDHSPEEDAALRPHFRQLFEAPKKLTLHEVAANQTDSTIWKLATGDPVARTVIFIEKPEDAITFRTRLNSQGCRTALLTGTMRGYERDSLVANETFKLFLQPEHIDPPVWLVTTSAGEVGLNVTCERMITGLVESDHLLQRFGRLNRFGGETGEIHVVFSPPNQKLTRLLKTVEYLRDLKGDASCKSVWNHRPPPEARSELPILSRLDPWRIASWAQTSYPDKAFSPVCYWLHGKQEENAPETEIAWRADVKFLTDWNIRPELIRQVLDSYPIGPQELLREPSARVLDKFRIIAGLSEVSSDIKLIVIESDGNVRVRSLSDITEQRELEYKRLLLPSQFGSIEFGMFRPAHSGDEVLFDVADLHPQKQRRRYLIEEDGILRIAADENEPLPGTSRQELGAFARQHGFKVPLVVRHPDDESSMLIYFGAGSQTATKRVDVSLAQHRQAVGEKAEGLSIACGLDGLSPKYRTAGELHDEGKHCQVWQRAMGGSMEKPLAKVVAPVNPKLTAGYRHELGSLRKAATESNDDLVLHLIASHHANGRPYFHTRQFDREALKDSATVALEQARRFGRLQEKYGPWGLAYLEAVFKCADGLVSAEEGDAASD